MEREESLACARCGAPTHDGGWCWACRAAGRRECPDCGTRIGWLDGEGACPLNCHQPPGWFAADDVLRCPVHGTLPTYAPMAYDMECPDCRAMQELDCDEDEDCFWRAFWRDWFTRLAWQQRKGDAAEVMAMADDAAARCGTDGSGRWWRNVAAAALEAALLEAASLAEARK